MFKNKILKGYVAIVSVITISAVALVIAVTVSLLAIGEAQSSLSYFKGENSLFLLMVVWKMHCLE